MLHLMNQESPEFIRGERQRENSMSHESAVNGIERQLRLLGWKETAKRWFDQDIKCAALARENEILRVGLRDFERKLAIKEHSCWCYSR